MTCSKPSRPPKRKASVVPTPVPGVPVGLASSTSAAYGPSASASSVSSVTVPVGLVPSASAAYGFSAPTFSAERKSCVATSSSSSSSGVTSPTTITVTHPSVPVCAGGVVPKTRPGFQVFVAGDEPEILGTPGLCLKRGAVDGCCTSDCACLPPDSGAGLAAHFSFETGEDIRKHLDVLAAAHVDIKRCRDQLADEDFAVRKRAGGGLVAIGPDRRRDGTPGATAHNLRLDIKKMLRDLHLMVAQFEEANLARECEEAAAEILPRGVGAVTAEPGDEGKRCFFPRPLKKQKVAPRRKDFRIRSSHPVPARPMELACDERGVNYPVEGVGRNHYFPSRAGSPAFNVESRLYLFFTECMDRLPTFDELNRYWPTQRVTNHYGSVVARFEMGVSYHCMPCSEDGREGSAMTREDLDAHRKGGACAIELPGRVDRMALNFAFALREAYRLRTAWLKYKSEGRMRA